MHDDDLEISPLWFAVYVQVRHELVIEGYLIGKNLECFLPRYTSRRQWKSRTKLLTLPLFPGYVFCRCATGRRKEVLGIPGVLRIVGYGSASASVDDSEIRSIQKAVGAGLACEPVPFVEHGQTVKIEAGPLSGSKGILVRRGDGERLVLSISLLQRSVAVEVDAEYACRLKRPELDRAGFDRFAGHHSA